MLAVVVVDALIAVAVEATAVVSLLTHHCETLARTSHHCYLPRHFVAGVEDHYSL